MCLTVELQSLLSHLGGTGTDAQISPRPDSGIRRLPAPADRAERQLMITLLREEQHASGLGVLTCRNRCIGP